MYVFLLLFQCRLTDDKRIERVAIEYNRLQFWVSRGQNLAFVSNIEPRIARIRDTLTETLASALRMSFILVSKSPEDHDAVNSLRQFIRTYLLIDKMKQAGAIFRECLVGPFISEVKYVLFVVSLYY